MPRGESGSPDTVGTTGVFRIAPGAINSVPAHAELEIDLRDTNLQTRETARTEIETRRGRGGPRGVGSATIWKRSTPTRPPSAIPGS